MKQNANRWQLILQLWGNYSLFFHLKVTGQQHFGGYLHCRFVCENKSCMSTSIITYIQCSFFPADHPKYQGTALQECWWSVSILTNSPMTFKQCNLIAQTNLAQFYNKVNPVVNCNCSTSDTYFPPPPSFFSGHAHAEKVMLVCEGDMLYINNEESLKCFTRSLSTPNPF